MPRRLSIDDGIRSSIHTHYVVKFYDDFMDVYVTDREEMVEIWIEVLEQVRRPDLGRLVVGLEATRRHRVIDQVATLQLCVDDYCLVFQIFRASNRIPQKLRDFLAQERYTFVGVNIQSNVEALFRDHGLRVGGRILDLSTLVAQRRLNNRLRVHYLIRRMLRRYIEVPERIVSGWWDSWELEPERVMYVCLDPYVSCRIGQLLLDATG